MRCILLVDLINVSTENDKYYGKSVSRLAYGTSREAKEMHEDYIETKIRDFQKVRRVWLTLRCEEVQTRRDSKKRDFHDQLHLLTV